MKIPLRSMSRMVIGAVIVACVIIIAFVATMPKASVTGSPTFAGTPLKPVPAPGLALLDQTGKRITLQAQRGHALIVTFFYTHCPDTCPMTAQKLRTVLTKFGPEARRVRVLVISTDPLHDNRANATAFLKKHGELSWHWLLGSYAQLRKVWKAYHVYAVPPAQEGKLGPTHTAGMYVINPQGDEKAYLDDSASADEIAQDLHIVLNDHRWVTSTVQAPQVGAVAPAFELPSLSGKRVSLDALRGRSVLVNFWATWCVPCKQEMPLLQRTFQRYRGKLQIIGVDQQEPESEVSAYVRGVHATYPIALDNDGNVAYKYEVFGTPTTFFIDRQGTIRHITIGALKAPSLAVRLRRLISR